MKDNKIDLFLDFDDKKINFKFKNIFHNSFKNCRLEIENLTNEDPFIPIKIYGDLLSKGWAREAIPVLIKKILGFQGYFQVYLNRIVIF